MNLDSASTECYITYEDPRYQTLILTGVFGTVGYSIDINSGDLQRVCVCAARYSSECCCGYDVQDNNYEYECD